MLRFQWLTARFLNGLPGPLATRAVGRASKTGRGSSPCTPRQGDHFAVSSSRRGAAWGRGVRPSTGNTRAPLEVRNTTTNASGPSYVIKWYDDQVSGKTIRWLKEKFFPVLLFSKLGVCLQNFFIP